jgi:tetratricopeptide (TPR) repeat protein
MRHVFISYAKEDIQLVQELDQTLHDSEYDPWYDPDLLPNDENPPERLRNRIASYEGFIFALSPSSLNSGRSQRELQHARDLGKPILVVQLRPNTPLPVELQQYAAVDFTQGPTSTAVIDLLKGMTLLEVPAQYTPVDVPEPESQSPGVFAPQAAQPQLQPRPGLKVGTDFQQTRMQSNILRYGIIAAIVVGLLVGICGVVLLLTRGPSVDQLMERASTNFQAGDYTQAIVNYNDVLQIDPRHVSAYYNRGNAYFQLNDLERALTDYTRALEIDPTHARSYWGLGNIAYSEQRFASALEHYRRYLDLAGNNPSDFVQTRVRELEVATPAP